MKCTFITQDIVCNRSIKGIEPIAYILPFDGLSVVVDENTMAAYKARVVKPIAFAIVDAMRRAFITKTARTQGQSIGCFSDPFELISPTTLAEVSDKLTRNEIVSSNEIRPKIGLSPSDDPGADELRNKNIAQPTPAPVSNKKEIDKGGPANV